MPTLTPTYLVGDAVAAGISGNKFSVERTYDTEVEGAIAAADIVRTIKMPAWTQPIDLQLKSNAANAGVTLKAGYAAVDGDVAYTDDDALIVAATAFATATRIRANSGVPIPVIPKEYYITITVAGGGIDATKLETILDYKYDQSSR